MRLRSVGRFASWPTPGRTWIVVTDVFNSIQNQDQGQGGEISKGQDQYQDLDQGPGLIRMSHLGFSAMTYFLPIK